MRWRAGKRSDNVVDRRGGGAALSGGAALVIVVISLIVGVDPRQMLGLAQQVADGGGGSPAPVQDETADFISAILGETEVTWGQLFRNGYAEPHLVLFTRAVQSACGGATSATGPFYCPADQRIYLDTSFFEDMTRRLGGGGDFAYAYVIAHEVGHHVQTLTGVSAEVQKQRDSGRPVEGAGGALVRLELQADCYAGIWAHHAEQRHQWLEAGDVQEALSTASAIGDDRLQRSSGGAVVPDSFTHGSSEQRVRWFQRGFSAGDPQDCDTFGATKL